MNKHATTSSGGRFQSRHPSRIRHSKSVRAVPSSKKRTNKMENRYTVKLYPNTDDEYALIDGIDQTTIATLFTNSAMANILATFLSLHARNPHILGQLTFYERLKNRMIIELNNGISPESHITPDNFEVVLSRELDKQSVA